MLTIHNHKPFSSLLLQCGVYIVPASSIHVQPQNSWNNPKQSVPVCCLTWFMHPNCLLLAPWLNGHANRISRSSHFSAYHSLPMGYVVSLVASLLGLMNQRWKIVARSLWFFVCVYMTGNYHQWYRIAPQTNMMRWWNPSHWYLKRQCLRDSCRIIFTSRRKVSFVAKNSTNLERACILTLLCAEFNPICAHH